MGRHCETCTCDDPKPSGATVLTQDIELGPDAEWAENAEEMFLSRSSLTIIDGHPIRTTVIGVVFEGRVAHLTMTLEAVEP